MSDIPKILSRDQIIGLLVDAYLSRTTTVTDLRKGSVLLSLLEAYGEAGFRISSDMIAMIDALSIDRASGDALKRIAIEKKVPIYSATKASGYVDISDKSIEKIEDKIYAGRPAPVAGSAFIFVADASKFPASGAIYIGRGTTAVEGPLSYGSTVRSDPDTGLPVQGIVPKAGGAYYMIVLNSSNETTKFHNLGESVILAQGGDRIIPSGTTVQTSQATSAEAVTFKTTATAKILDGEVKVERVPVVADQTGTKGNVARGAIREVLGVNFDAECTNPLAFTSARDDDTDEILRERIKKYEQSRTKGTEEAIKNAAIDVVSQDELKRVTSAEVKRTSGSEQILIFDDGTGYEAIDGGIGLEQILDEAAGGEKEFQLLNTMIERATVKTLNKAPFDIVDGDTLTVEIVGLGQFSHTFNNAFKIYRQADAFEVVSSINANYNLPFVARTVDGGKRVALTPKTAHNIRVLSGGANVGLAFPTNPVYTIRLYRNDKTVYQEGKKAFVTSLSQSNWSSIVSGSPFVFSVDGTPPVSVTITDADFQKYSSIYVVNKDMPIDVWAKVLNDKLGGITVTVVGDKLQFESNLGASDRAEIRIDTSNTSYVGSSMFGTNAEVYDFGLSSDFNLNLKTGQLEFLKPFDLGESVTAGSKFTRAKFDTVELPTTLSLGTDKIYLFITVDGNADTIAHNVDSTGLTFTAAGSGYPPTAFTVTSNNGAFENIIAGDYMIAWKNAGESFLQDGNLGVFRVIEVDPSANKNYIIINNPEGVLEGPTQLPAIGRLVFVRSKTPVQILEIDPLVVVTPSDLRDTINSKLRGVKATTIGTVVRVESNSLDESKSELLIAAATDNATPLGYKVGKYTAVSSHNGFINSDINDGYGMPNFKLLQSENLTLSPTIKDNNKYYLNEGTQNDIIQWLNWNSGYFNSNAGVIESYSHTGMNKNIFEQVYIYDTLNSTINPIRKGLSFMGTYSGTSFPLVGGYTQGEQFTLRQGLMFDAQDKLSFIVDQDDKIKAYTTPVSRKVRIKSSPLPSPISFDLEDAESNLAFNNPATFRDFDFSNFKFWIRPKLSLQNMNFKYTDFGPAGSRVGISIGYTTKPDAETSHEIIEGDITEIKILPSTGPEFPHSANSTTTWTVESVGTSGTIEYYKYTYRSGTAPLLALPPGSLVNIAQGSSLLSKNKGVFRVTDNPLYPPTSTTFTVERLLGEGETDIIVNSSIIYPYYTTVPFTLGGTLRITTTTPHNVNVGDVIGIYGANVPEYNSSFVVTAIPSPTILEASATGINGGATKTVRRVQLSSAPAWSNTTTYTANDVVIRTGIYYIALGTNTNADPPLNLGTFWAAIPGGNDHITIYETFAPHNLTVNDSIKISNIPTFGPLASFNGTFTVLTSATPTTFSHVHNIGSPNAMGTTTLSQGRVDQQATSFGNLSKGLKIVDALNFYEITEDQNSLKTYIDDKLSNYFEVEILNPTDPVLPVQELKSSGSVSLTIYPIYGTKYRLIQLPTAPTFKKGAKIVFNLAPSSNSLRTDIHNNEFQVIETENNTIKVISSRFALPSESPLTLNGSWVSKQSVFGFGDGESYVKTNDLSQMPISPSFTLKKPLLDIAGDDEAYLIATTPEQLSRLFANLANSGLSNVAELTSSLVESELQVNTKTFGSDGGIQMSGGRANSHGAAVIGAGQTRNGSFGFDIQSDLRIGFNVGSYIRAYNTIPQRKTLNFNTLTSLTITASPNYAIIQKTSGGGSFQTKRPVTLNGTEDIKVEKHGNFVCYSQVGGTAMNLIANGVREGDWVRIHELPYSNSPLYNPKFLSNNQGIYKVVRLYGDAFWIENPNGVDQFVTNINTNSITFYSHDSVMPGDKLVISSDVLGDLNIGTYTVAEWDDANSYPSTNAIKVNGVFQSASATLGINYIHVNILEKEPLSLIKKVYGASPSSTGSDYSFLQVDSDNLIDRINAVSGGGIKSLGKLNMDESTKLGLDAYRYYRGLIAQLYKVIYGQPNDPSFEGVRAAGADIDIQPPLIRRIQVTLDIRIKTGIPFLEIIDAVRSAAAGYINSLNVGQPVSTSALISAVQSVDGIVSVTVASTNPTQNNGIIKVLPEEVAKIVNPDIDITVNIVSG